MIFKEYVKGLNKLLAERPETGELETISSADDEGNDFIIINYDPSVGHFDQNERGFTPEGDEDFDGVLNAVCIN